MERAWLRQWARDWEGDPWSPAPRFCTLSSGPASVALMQFMPNLGAGVRKSHLIICLLSSPLSFCFHCFLPKTPYSVTPTFPKPRSFLELSQVPPPCKGSPLLPCSPHVLLPQTLCSSWPWVRSHLSPFQPCF